jgi:hypothetical protein
MRKTIETDFARRLFSFDESSPAAANGHAHSWCAPLELRQGDSSDSNSNSLKIERDKK